MKVYVSQEFESWLAELRDDRIRGRVLARLRLIGLGSFGDRKPITKGLHEIRLHTSNGVRLYFFNSINDSIVVVFAGHKGTQKSDIKKATDIKNSFKEA